MESKPGRELGKAFWEGKTPCWEICRCPEMIKNECPAPKYLSLPCWQIEGTYCKLDDEGVKGDDTTICRVCRVYKKWGAGQPIRITLLGKGINSAMRAMKQSAAKSQDVK